MKWILFIAVSGFDRVQFSASGQIACLTTAFPGVGKYVKKISAGSGKKEDQFI